MFVTDFNRKVYGALSKRLDESRSIDLSVFTGDFLPEESGRLAKFIAMRDEISNTVAECLDCIEVLKKEAKNNQKVNPSEMSDEEFLELFRKKSN